MKNKAAKKNALLNAIMVASVIVIALSGLLLVGRMKGWFEKEKVTADAEEVTEEFSDVWTVTEKTGGVNIYRGGLAYALNEENRLRSGDTVETLNRSALTIGSGTKTLRLDENSRMNFVISGNGTEMTLENGGAFLQLDSDMSLKINGETVRAEDAVVLASANYGSGSVSVLRGEASLCEKTLLRGERASILSKEQGGISIAMLSLQSLSSFELGCIRTFGENLCFSPADVAALEQQREQEKQHALEAAFISGTGKQEINHKSNAESGAAVGTEPAETAEVQSVSTIQPAEEDFMEAESTQGAIISGQQEESTEDTDALFMPVCTLEIRCDTILDNMADLTGGKEGYVPSNGVILAASKISFEEGETVFDVLKRACSLAGIQLEYSWTPVYDSYYVEGINNLYEFDCGEQSGWMYKVNGWFPNYGCSSYTLEDGDVIVWCFTCSGLGADVGGAVY